MDKYNRKYLVVAKFVTLALLLLTSLVGLLAADKPIVKPATPKAFVRDFHFNSKSFNIRAPAAAIPGAAKRA